MATRIRYEQAPNAFDVIEDAAAPALGDVARAIAERIPSFIPVQSGVARRTYRLSVAEGEDGGHPEARVNVDSPFWHFLEYGTRFNPAYRPIQTAIGALGLRYQAK